VKRRELRKIVDTGDAQVIATMDAAIEDYFGVAPVGLADKLRHFKAVIQKEKLLVKAGQLPKAATWASQLRKLGDQLNGTGNGDELATLDDGADQPLAQHVVTGALRKGGKMPKDPALKAAKQVAKARAARDGVRWSLLKRKQKQRRIEVELAAAGDPAAAAAVVDRHGQAEEAALAKVLAEEKELVDLHERARSGDPVTAAKARSKLEKLADTATRAALRKDAVSGSVAEVLGVPGFRPAR